VALEGAEHLSWWAACPITTRGTYGFPEEDDFRIYREESGVDWDLAKSPRDQEVWRCSMSRLRRLKRGPKPIMLFADAGRALGYPDQCFAGALRNCLGIDLRDRRGFGALSRYDTKGTSLPGPISE